MILERKIVWFIILVVFSSCMHEPKVGDGITTFSTSTNVTTTCVGCPTQPVCPVTDDIIVNTSTTYSTCEPNPVGQGTFILDANNCLIWTPSANQTDIVNTCIIACTNGVCDTTFLVIFPPVPVDTTSTGTPCDPNIVYFERDILPILTTNCAFAGCHNAGTASDGVKLDNYQNVISTAKVKPFNPNNSELYEVITENDPKDVMPPPPAAKLTQDQINIIAKWINQGAKNEMCDFNSEPCNITNVSYNTFVKPTLAACTTCHKTGNAGGGINLDSYAGMKSAAESGRLYGALSWASGYMTMPQGGSKLSDCQLSKIKSWIDAGAPQN
jgi:hypothetical protein